MNDLSARIAALTPEQRVRFEASLKAKGLRVPQVDQIPRRPREDVNLFPTSIDQERLWFIEQLQPGNAAYNIFTASRIKGPLDVAVMERVVNELIARHEVVRTTFTVVDDQPMQVIHPKLEVTLTPVDLQSVPLEQREQEALRLVTEDFSRPFDLEQGPLLRVGLLRLAEDDHVMHINMHHTVTDRWSGAIFE
ncbi:MAG TPA: condensation domain-containing protein, partial [Pyrinomonadaceae bacterium]